MLVLVYWLACDLRYILRDSAGALSTYRTAMSLILPVLSLAVFLLVHLPVCSLALLRAAVRAYCLPSSGPTSLPSSPPSSRPSSPRLRCQLVDRLDPRPAPSLVL